MDWNYAASENYIKYPGREKDSSAYLGIFKGHSPIIVIMRYSSQFGVYITLQCCGTRAGWERPGRAGCHASTTHVTTGRTSAKEKKEQQATYSISSLAKK